MTCDGFVRPPSLPPTGARFFCRNRGIQLQVLSVPRMLFTMQRFGCNCVYSHRVEYIEHCINMIKSMIEMMNLVSDACGLISDFSFLSCLPAAGFNFQPSVGLGSGADLAAAAGILLARSRVLSGCASWCPRLRFRHVDSHSPPSPGELIARRRRVRYVLRR